MTDRIRPDRAGGSVGRLSPVARAAFFVGQDGFLSPHGVGASGTTLRGVILAERWDRSRVGIEADSEDSRR